MSPLAEKIAQVLMLVTLLATPLVVGRADTVNPRNKGSSQRYFLRHYAKDKEHFHWSGSSDTPSPGVMSAAFTSALLKRFNYYRAMSGVGPLALAGSAQAQLCAHLHASNSTLDFDEATPDLRFYSPEAAAACSLADTLFQVDDTSYVVNYWLSGASYYHSFPLSPAFSAVGIGGAAAGSVNLQEYHFAAIFDGNLPLQTRDGFVAFPSPGYAPIEAFGQINYIQFYATAGVSVDMSGCIVTLRVNGKRVHAILDYNTAKTANDPRLLSVTSDRLFAIQNKRALKNLSVSVSNVLIDGVPTTYRWRTAFFKASRK